jgi:hypothetical protein
MIAINSRIQIQPPFSHANAHCDGPRRHRRPSGMASRAAMNGGELSSSSPAQISRVRSFRDPDGFQAACGQCLSQSQEAPSHPVSSRSQNAEAGVTPGAMHEPHSKHSADAELQMTAGCSDGHSSSTSYFSKKKNSHKLSSECDGCALRSFMAAGGRERK